MALVGEGFERITQVEALRVHLAKAEAKWRVDALERRVRDRARRQRNVRLGIVAGIALVVAGVAFHRQAPECATDGAVEVC